MGKNYRSNGVHSQFQAAGMNENQAHGGDGGGDRPPSNPNQPFSPHYVEGLLNERVAQIENAIPQRLCQEEDQLRLVTSHRV